MPKRFYWLRASKESLNLLISEEKKEGKSWVKEIFVEFYVEKYWRDTCQYLEGTVGSQTRMI